ncbi:MAG: 3-deoxy-D-manno-octulosonic acid transferase [Chthoniobacterales bacterium]|jgi:3-deoxy-D-manno-octulosonic-acid transferase
MRFLYNAVFPLVLFLSLPAYLVRMVRRGNYRRDFAQRLGRYKPDVRARFSTGEWVWVHAVSVGELLVALKIITELHRRHPAWRFVVSSTTSTAHALAQEKQEDWWVPVYTPVDLAAFVRRALDTVRPKAVVLVEGEMWPNFVWTCSDRGIPVMLANARVSPRSARRYRKFARIVRAVGRHLAGVGLQEAADEALWRTLGVTADRISVTGSVKYDPGIEVAPPRDFRPVLDAWGIGRDEPVILAGSTHRGEEEELLAALAIAREKHPHARLLVAPRHVERLPEILARLDDGRFRLARRTTPPSPPAPDVLLIDTTGELRDWYASADIVFIGKSLTGRGGQNPVEALMAGRPVVFGPHMENFAALAAELLASGGAVAVRNAGELGATLRELFDNPVKRDSIAARGAAALERHRGATSRTADMVERLAAKG